MASSALNHGLVDGKEYMLKLGTSFQSKKATESYHLMRYDFKPPSVDTSRPVEVTIGTNNECTVTIPNIHDSGTTTYKGGKKPCTKECVLIIDKKTGEITLERISSNIPLKKSRANRTSNVVSLNKNVSKLNPPSSTNKPLSTSSNSQTTSTTSSNPTKPTSSQSSSQSNTFVSPAKVKSAPQHSVPPPPVTKTREVSTTSTSDSSSSDSSESDSETEKEMAADIENETFSTKAYQPPPPPTKVKAPNKSGSFSTLHSDLQLSDSNESDSD